MNGLRSLLYLFVRLLGDANAIDNSIRQRSLEPVAKRYGRKFAGRIVGGIINSIFR